MKNKILLTILAGILLMPTGISLRAAEQAQESELNLPWEAFKKLLKLDQDEISLTWDEFQRLLKQTGVEETPHFQMKK